jgi:tRNA A-37 threonylcarbamoyl transferase component Bud32
VPVETLGRYRIERELGRGAMGRVFLAFDTEIHRRVAIKTIQAFEALPEADRKEARERFLREARAAGRLLHPGIVTIFDVGEADGIPYLAMEHVAGTTLDAYCREGDLLPPATVAGLIAHAAEALAFAHARGVVHRDVKPANLMRVGTTSVKVMDFGLAKNVATKMTHDGALFGTPNYMSPEQVRGEALDGRSDLFSLGVVLYEMLVGTKPFAGDSVSSVLYRIVHEPPRDITPHLARVPAPLGAVVAKALAKRREDRFADGLELAATLRRVFEPEAAAPESSRPRPRPRPGAPLPAPRAEEALPPPPSHTRRRSFFPYAIAAVFVIALVAAAILLSGRGDSVAKAAPLSARVRSEPPGAAVLLDGRPVQDGIVRFDAGGPFGVLSAAQGCRQATHTIEAADAGREIVLALDPERADVDVDAAAAGATLIVNGAAPVSLPARVSLDLCRENRLEAKAPGYKDGLMLVPAGATPLAARTSAEALRLEKIPLGRVTLPKLSVALRYAVDGQPVARGDRALELPAGRHELRATNDDLFLDLVVPVEIPPDGSVAAAVTVPPIATLVVQSFPPEAEASLSREGGTFRGIGDTPLKRPVVAGAYVLRLKDPASGATREQRIVLRAGNNPPVRVSFQDRP